MCVEQMGGVFFMGKYVLMIDPGHGGNDPGGGTNHFWKEKDLALKISKYQYHRFKKLGLAVTMTRYQDETLSPIERTQKVLDSDAKYCISNHINAGGGDGAEVIHSIYDSGALAKAITKELQAAGQHVRRIFTRTLPNHSSQDYYFMMRQTGSVMTNIIEYGFADSKGDDISLLQRNWQSLAEAVVKAFCLFYGHPYKSARKTIEKKLKQQASYLHLPKLAKQWRVYDIGIKPIKGNEKGFLSPYKFKGLTYKILDTIAPYVYLIETRDFGKVQIYGHPSTGAIVSNH